jgi:gliding motility-associated-like protein
MKNHLNVFLLVAICLCAASFHAHSQLKADFSANTMAGCSPLVVQFSDKSTGGATSWRWDLGNGTISLFQNPSTVYFSPGTYTVKQVIKNAAGADSIEKVHYITVYDNPVVDFTASDSTGCFPLPLQFTDKSTVSGAAITKWQWDFGDGDTASAQNPFHTYHSPGNFSVTLNVTSDKGCSKSFGRAPYVQINSGVIANFDYTAASHNCSAPVTIQFNNTSVESGTVAYQWNFGDGQTTTAKNPTHTYTANGTYTVTLIAVNNTGCSDTLRKTNLLVIGSGTTGFNIPDSICAGEPFYAINTSTPASASVQWLFGDGSSSVEAAPQKAYNTAGTYTVKLINYFAACTDSLSRSIKVLPKPVAVFTSNQTYSCSAPATIQFYNNAIGAVAYKWIFGDGATSTSANPAHVYTSFGNYTVTLVVTGANGCTDTITKPNYIGVKRPVVTINNLPVKGCLPLTVPFSANVAVQDNVTAYHWDFGDGTSATQANPVKIYTTEGSYTVKLVITTAMGCSDSVTMTGAVQTAPVPKAEFTATPRDICRSASAGFINQSTPTGDQWLWQFGDGGSSTNNNPVYQYSDTGYYNVSLIVTSKGCSDTITKKAYIHVNPPVARFITSMDCKDKYQRTFTDQSTAAQSWQWDMGDGAASTAQNPVHRYAAKGIYKVRLIVTHDGCVDSMSQNIVIADEHPGFDADKNEVCKQATVAFSLTNFTPAYLGGMVWNFGDGTASATLGNVSHVYTHAGTFKVSVVYTDVNGCVDSTVKTQYIKVNGPTAAFGVAQPKICIDNTAAFIDQSTTDGEHAIVKWDWNYGDGSPDQSYTAAPFKHTYNNGNTFTVSLQVTDNAGCTNKIAKANAVIVSNPKAAFTSADTSSCPGKPVNFANASSGTQLQYTWDFGDGTVAAQQAPAHQYLQEGVYTVNLLVVDPVGCRDSIKRANYIKISIPVAQFAISDSVGSCPPLQVQFTNQATNYTAIRWDFGDGNTSTLHDPVHFYNVPGVYYATQYITGPGGCTDVMQRKIVVKGPKGSFVYTPTTGCAPMKVAFNATGNGIQSLVWDFNDGNTNATTTTSVEYTYNTAGKFIPRLILVDSAGCQVPVIGADTINAIGVVANADMDTYRICNSGSIQFTDRSVANDYITGHLWNFGDGATSTQASPKHTYSAAPATYTITHTVTTANGCTAVSHLTDTIKVYATPKIAITGDKEACVPGTLAFNAVITGNAAGLTKYWNLGNGTTAGDVAAVSQTYNAAGNYQVQLQTIYQDYCRDTARYNVDIWPLPNTFAGNDTVACLNKPVQLHAAGAAQYIWNASPDISCTQCAAPLINPADNTAYVVTGASVHGCVKSDTLYVRVRKPFTMVVQPGATLCAGQQFTLGAVGADKYQWSPAATLDNATSPTPKATPAATTVYTVVGRDNDNCFADTGSVKVVVYPIPGIFAGNDTTVSTGSTIRLPAQSSADITSWNWTPADGLSCTNCSTPNATIKGSVTYKVTARNDGGCTASDDITITSVCNSGNWFIPNTFSPNGDGMNDVFYVRGKGLYQIHSLRIFNRWGQAVFEKRDFMANDPAAGWDGKINGKPADMDVYVYIVEIVCDNSSIVPYKGNVALIR